ncbi:hypothetical protein ACRYCC_38500 [Actinomadura scrupuli]|uniref:hypothetical protein n=1 Tax=Actinomadura scrupuli TaxID=559629 RepID=UPI003D990912
MEGFILGVVGSLAATALTVAGGWMFSQKVRQWPMAVLSRFTGLGVQRVYPQQRMANLDLPGELRRARWVNVLTGRGNELTRDGFSAVWAGVAGRVESVRVLLPDPGLGPDSWLSRREADMRRVELGIHSGLLADQVRANAAYIQEVARQRESVALRFYDLPNLYRVIITDNIAYLTIYGHAEHGRNSPCIVARRPGLMYDFAVQLFATAWKHGRPADGQAGT